MCLRMFSQEGQNSSELAIENLSISETSSLLNAEDLQYYLKAPTDVFLSIHLFNKWKSHCKEQYWFYRNWFMNWYYTSQQLDCDEPIVNGSHSFEVTSTGSCEDGETKSSSNSNEKRIECDSSGDAKFGEAEKNQSAPVTFLNGRKENEDDPEDRKPFRMKKEHELDLDEIGEDTNHNKTCSKNDDEDDQNQNDVETSQSSDEDVENIGFPVACATLGYRFNDDSSGNKT